jgi:signal transduction histidine kinase
MLLQPHTDPSHRPAVAARPARRPVAASATPSAPPSSVAPSAQAAVATEIAAASPAARPIPPSTIRRDLGIVIALTLATYLFAAIIELHESMVVWMARWEAFQLDEVPAAVTVLAFGLAWFAFRRRAEAAQAMQLQAHAQAEAMELLAHNRELARQLMTVQENERRSLARELHDELGQRCNAIRVEAAYIQRAHDPAEIHAAADRAAASAETLYQHVRDLLRRLRPAELDELGLVAALQALCESWEMRSGVACIFLHDGSFGGVGEQTATALYRVAQEGLTNVMRHGHATRVRVDLRRGADGELQLKVEDDGCGFDTRRHNRGLGLLGAQERAAALGGSLRIDSQPGNGTRVALTLPADAANA